MTMAATTALPRNLKEIVASYPEVVYTETAFRGEMESDDTRPSYKTPMLCKPLPNHTRCHEYLGIDFMASDLEPYNDYCLREYSLTNAKYVEKDERKTPVKQPAAYYFYNFGLVLTVWVSLIQWTAIIFAGVGIIASIFTFFILMIRDGFASVFTPSELLDSAYGFFLVAVLPYSVYLLMKFLHYKELPNRFSKAPGIRLILRRDTGMVQFKKKGRFIDVPFPEVMGMTQHYTDDSGIRRITLHLNHKHSKLNRNLDNGLQALGSALHENERWWYHLRWEFFQHYMDVTRPLPDIPEFEPYRHLDPTTREWDKKHNRPKDYWLTMDQETYQAMVDAAKEKAKAYPYDAPAFADQIGWTPAGDGKAWYQLG